MLGAAYANPNDFYRWLVKATTTSSHLVNIPNSPTDGLLLGSRLLRVPPCSDLCFILLGLHSSHNLQSRHQQLGWMFIDHLRQLSLGTRHTRGYLLEHRWNSYGGRLPTPNTLFPNCKVIFLIQSTQCETIPPESR